ncbi:hypothetical protein H9L39_01090 [Fusarium oxysporum f. sp. albedinis]|nr:hypothetical protein H9L39_01090 [Fusarium oxysporum f. sp. albedinis]
MDGDERKEFIVFWLVLVKGRGGGDGTRFSPEAKQKKWSLGLAVHLQGTQHPLRQSVAVEDVEVTKVLPLAAGHHYENVPSSGLFWPP